MAYTYKYPRPMVCTDIVLTRPHGHKKQVLLIQRGNPPFQGQWALPGGFVNEDEPLHEAAARELMEETDINGVELSQFRTYGDKGRDPRGHCISIVFYGTAPQGTQAQAADDAAQAQWYSLDNLPPLAFDHQRILTEFIRFL
jgi:8-oxo-dGTP diphosphatase